MTETAHTPGPWEVDNILSIDGVDVSAGVYFLPADDDPTEDDIICRASPANARLIAAAPEMLAALERQAANIAHWLETGVPAGPDESRAIYEQICAAIAKATAPTTQEASND